MKNFLTLTLEGRRFVLSKDEAQFLADRLHTAGVMPATALQFTHENAAGGVSIRVERSANNTRGTGRTVTDC